MKFLIHIALLISIITYSFWESFPKGSFYIGNAIVFLIIGLYLFLKNRDQFICFVFFAYSINNMLDEIFFEPSVFGINEKIFAVIVILLWFYKKKCDGRKIL